jgi:hypothetical protein
MLGEYEQVIPRSFPVVESLALFVNVGNVVLVKQNLTFIAAHPIPEYISPGQPPSR